MTFTRRARWRRCRDDLTQSPGGAGRMRAFHSLRRGIASRWRRRLPGNQESAEHSNGGGGARSMRSTKRKTKEDTWKSEELLRHLKGEAGKIVTEQGSMEAGGEAAQGDHAEEADAKSRERRKSKVEEASGVSESRERRPKEKEKDYHKDRVRDKDKDREKHKDRDRNQEEDPKRERDREPKKDRDRERHGDRDSEKDQIKERDRDKDKIRDRERERQKIRDAHIDRHKERDKKSEKDREKEKPRKKEKDRHREREKEREHENGGKHSKHRPRKEDEENGDTPKSDKFEEKERKHREKKAKEGTDISEESREKKKKDENRERRHREHKEREHDSRGTDREKRYKEKKPVQETPSEETDGKHQEEREKGHGNKRHKDTKESNAESGDMEREHRDKQKQNERNENQQRRHKEKEKEKLGWETEPNEEIEKEEIIVEKPSVVESSQYEDDFEDYADDFEEDEDEEDEDGELQREDEIPAYKRAEIEEIQRAITAENERIFTIQRNTGIGGQTCEKEPKSDAKESKESQQRNPARGTFIDFVSAKKREVSRKAANRQKKRCIELLRLVDLDFSINFSLLDMPPLNEYDMYIKNFGRTNTKQAYIQCNEDDIDRNIQTEEIETVEKWTQHPGESNLVCGGPNTSDTLTSDSVAMHVDSRRLANFLRSACQVIAVLLEEDRAENQANQSLQSKPASLSISDRSSQLNTQLPFFHGRQVLCLHFSQVQRQTLLSVHSVPKEPVAVQLDNKYIICVWNIWEPSAPQKVLVCESAVQCCCFSPGRAISVFAGTVDGSVVLWDLRQHSSTHHTLQIGSQEWTFRSPTFSTDGVLTAVNHSCAVKAVAPVSSPSYENQGLGLPLLTSHEGSSGQSFQMASLDESGLLNLWVVVELQKADVAGSLTDLGLSPGGKVKLLHSSSININSSFIPRDLMQLGPPQTLNIKFLPSDPNHFFVGTDIGLVSHGTLHGLRAPPKLYKSQLSTTRPIQVTSIDFCNFEEAIFLVGCSDGMIRLHSVAAERPLMQWNDSTQGRRIQTIQWALTRPAVFFVLDVSSNIYAWDLLEDDSKPIAKESLPSDLLTAMVVLGEPEKTNASSGLVLAKGSGLIEIQYLKKHWSGPRSDEVEKFHHFLQQVV
ncbi:cytoplasmic dynein 2 intermediate chain 1 [Callorhinchus milii]|uniref:cytoplasmic dynein 2 intermediate chain 1 n=1 Tax=Callorhinchus milii TaxID=7868 RepID=UPI001C3F6786|nr:cytoplasmic dynein 2 intermediate chain 1 [Callorhinchus milii]